MKPSFLLLPFVVMTAATAAAQDLIFADGFESGDTLAWSRTEPPLECDQITTFEDGLHPTTVLHVATDGDDATGDGTIDNPFATIARAARNINPGTAVRVHAGSYAGGTYLADLAGTAAAPIWIGGAPGEPRPVISGSSQGLHLSRVEWVVVHDLEVQGASANGINCDDGGDYDDPEAAHHVVFRGLEIHDIGSGGNQDCLKLSGLNQYWVLDSEFARCGGSGSGSGVDHVGCHHGLLARNVFEDLSGNAVQAKGGSEDIEIRWSHFVDGGWRSLNLGGSTGFTYFRPPLSDVDPNAEARNIRVVANLIEGSEAAIAYVGCVGCVVVNNTIVDPHNWILRILQETTTVPPYVFEPCRDGVFVNNLVYFSWGDLSTWVNIGPNTAPETFTFANNLWYAWDSPPHSEPSLPAPETGGVYGQDPGFTTAYHIDASSPAFGAGLPNQWITGDNDGVCYRHPPSIGAFEVP
jgi:hypothetical protein